jgi:hypothetical protein
MKINVEAIINQFVLTLLFPIILMFNLACGGGSEDITQEINDDLLNNPPLAPAIIVNPGIYFGGMTPSGGTEELALAIVHESGRTRLVNIENGDVFVGGYVESNFIGTLYSTTNVISDGQVSASGGNFSGTYSSELGSGTLSFIAEPALYNQIITLAMLEDTWVDDLFIERLGTTTWNLQSDGSLTMLSSENCTASGQINLPTAAKNELAISATLSDCGEFDGEYTGIGFVGETFNPMDTMVLVFNNSERAGFNFLLR